MSFRRNSALAMLVAGLGLPSVASAEIPLWQERADDDSARDLKLLGYVQPGYVWRQNDGTPGDPNPNTEDGFLVARARLGVTSHAGAGIHLKLEGEFAGTPMLMDGYGDAKLAPELRLRLGQQKLPFLRANAFSDSHTGFHDRPLYVPQAGDRAALRYAQPRDVGLMAHGRIGAPSPESTAPVLDYGVGIFHGGGPNQVTNVDDAYLYAGRVTLHTRGVPRGEANESDLERNPVPKVAVGGGVYSNCDDRGQWIRGFTGDLELRFEGLYALGTLAWFRLGPSTGLGQTLGYGGTRRDDGSYVRPACGKGRAVPALDHVASGWSGQVQYTLPRAWLGDERAVELLFRADAVDAQAPCLGGDCAFFGDGESSPGYRPPERFDDADNPPARLRFTAGVNFFPDHTQSLRLSVNYQVNRETEDLATPAGNVVGIANDLLWFQLTVGL